MVHYSFLSTVAAAVYVATWWSPTNCYIHPLMFTMNSPRPRVYLLVLIKSFFCALRFFWHTLCHVHSYCLLFYEPCSLPSIFPTDLFCGGSVLVCLFVVACLCCCHIVLSLTANFLFFKLFTQALWPTQLPTQLAMMLISHLRVVLRLSTCGAIQPLLHVPSLGGA